MRNERPDVSAVVIVSLREVLGRGSERADRLYKSEWVQKKATLSRSQGVALPSSLAFRARHARFPHKFQIPAKLGPQSHVLENPLSSFCPDNVFPIHVMTVCH